MPRTPPCRVRPLRRAPYTNRATLQGAAKNRLRNRRGLRDFGALSGKEGTWYNTSAKPARHLQKACLLRGPAAFYKEGKSAIKSK